MILAIANNGTIKIAISAFIGFIHFQCYSDKKEEFFVAMKSGSIVTVTTIKGVS